MSWGRTDDVFTDHPKYAVALELGGPGSLALLQALWCLAGRRNGARLVGAQVRLWVRALKCRARQVDALVTAGLLERDGDDAFLVHDYDDYRAPATRERAPAPAGRSAESLEKRRVSARERMRHVRIARGERVANRGEQNANGGEREANAANGSQFECEQGANTPARVEAVTRAPAPPGPVPVPVPSLASLESAAAGASRTHEGAADLSPEASELLVALRGHRSLATVATPRLAVALEGARLGAGKPVPWLVAAIAEAAGKAAADDAVDEPQAKSRLARFVAGCCRNARDPATAGRSPAGARAPRNTLPVQPAAKDFDFAAWDAVAERNKALEATANEWSEDAAQ